VIVPALTKKTPANSAAISKRLKILLEPCRESKPDLLSKCGTKRHPVPQSIFIISGRY
jgi:hypothetical protein